MDAVGAVTDGDACHQPTPGPWVQKLLLAPHSLWGQFAFSVGKVDSDEEDSDDNGHGDGVFPNRLRSSLIKVSSVLQPQ